MTRRNSQIIFALFIVLLSSPIFVTAQDHNSPWDSRINITTIRIDGVALGYVSDLSLSDSHDVTFGVSHDVQEILDSPDLQWSIRVLIDNHQFIFQIYQVAEPYVSFDFSVDDVTSSADPQWSTLYIEAAYFYYSEYDITGTIPIIGSGVTGRIEFDHAFSWEGAPPRFPLVLLAPIGLGIVGIVGVGAVLFYRKRKATSPVDYASTAPITEAQEPEMNEVDSSTKQQVSEATGMIVCPFCGTRTQAGLDKCQICGAEL